MDPITLILTALATGAVAGLKPTAEKVVKDAYEGLKTLLKNKYERSQRAVPVLEGDPASEAGKAVVREALEQEGAGQDEAVLRQAQAVLQAVRDHEPAAAEAAGIRIRDLEAGASVRIEDLVSEGAVDIETVRAKEDITIRGVRAGEGGSTPGKADAPNP